jgi:2-C-methyl-D-erythritol 2,4-cyclodiphosphate synthase
MDFRTGLGYDIHRFAEGRKLVLGGVDIPYERGLDGHSDADVLLHAVCDALLGALGKGDIGEMFPNTDEKYRGISSMLLLEHVARLVEDEGYAVGNVDAVVIAESPKISKFKDKMKFNIAFRLAVEENCVNVKATTNEGMGAIGRNEGIASFATVMLLKK